MRNEALKERTEHDLRLARLDFDSSPFTIAWEVTRACAYACLHCRASAQPKRSPNELTTEEGRALINDLAGFETGPILVLTGGDPLMRRDLFDLAAYADYRGLRVSLTPTATALVTAENMERARDAGIRRVAFSVDAADRECHDRFRGFQGSFERTCRGIECAKAAGLPLQINTTVTTINAGELEQMVELLTEWQIVQWSVFFLVPTGRGEQLDMVDAEQHEHILTWLFDLTARVPFDIKATAAPHYRRIAIQRSGANGGKDVAGAGYSYSDGLDRPSRGVNDGRGFMFISDCGDVYPSGFLPLAAGNVRTQNAVNIYRNSALFRELRDPTLLKGKCGLCQFKEVCGGSRARAYAVSGDYLAEEPMCAFFPDSAKNH